MIANRQVGYSRLNEYLNERLCDRSGKAEYRDFLNMLFEDYKSILENLKKEAIELNLDEGDSGDWDTLLSVVHKSCDTILECVDTYLAGDIYKAYEIIAKYLLMGDSPVKAVEKKIFDEPLYRMRLRNPGERPYKKKDMFYVPFEKRHVIESSRYSILGYPCLYASLSMLAAWCEMKEPTLESFCVSAIKVPPLKLVCLNVFTGERPTVRQLNLWPLVMACSVTVKHPESPFKPEYIIPQLVMSVIQNSTDLDGCLYTTTQKDNYFEVEEEKWWNVAIPAIVSSPNSNGGKKPLEERFEWTDSICYTHESIWAGGFNAGVIDADADTLEENYRASIFGQMEECLKGKFDSRDEVK